MRKTLALILATAGLAFGIHAAFAHSAAQAGVVVVQTNLAYENGSAAGTGIVLTSGGEVLTNNHVIRGATTIKVVVPQTRKRYAARVLGYSATADVALLQLKNASGLATATIGTSSTLRVGQSATAVGNAGGTGSLAVTKGKITGLNRTITVNDEQGGAVQLAKLVETDAGLQPGDSGGPLLDSAGRVIGIDTAASTTFSFESSNDGYAIPIDRAVSVVRLIRAGRSSSTVHVGATAFLGVQVQAAYNGEIVSAVVPGSPAAKAGIVAGDVITAVNGHLASTPTAVVAQISTKHPGDKVAVKWINQAGTHTATVTLGSGPPQ